ncbi:hypothetical protein LC082_08580 [Microbacterium esteraromaticum]|uniref:hypothetical protein n=1 Tax=Microbacterium esteraromaticum TaxID=57043 RepID=UPI001CD6F159|nr:hypothetical protein [Microbacterium esteraromaticum]MCA1306953.1 hypothetical protein [Microbacterium esteraromaticum]
MSSRPLDPLTALSIELSATMSRHKYTSDSETAIGELRQLAADHPSILATEAGRWAGFHETDPHSTALVDALKAISTPDAIALGRSRFMAGSHTTP